MKCDNCGEEMEFAWSVAKIGEETYRVCLLECERELSRKKELDYDKDQS